MIGIACWRLAASHTPVRTNQCRREISASVRYRPLLTCRLKSRSFGQTRRRTRVVAAVSTRGAPMSVRLAWARRNQGYTSSPSQCGTRRSEFIPTFLMRARSCRNKFRPTRMQEHFAVRSTRKDARSPNEVEHHEPCCVGKEHRDRIIAHSEEHAIAPLDEPDEIDRGQHDPE